MVKAYVLAAGVGSRLRPLTDELPKGLVPLLNRPLLSYLIAHLRPHVQHTRFNLAYQKRLLAAYLSQWTATSSFDEGDAPLGSACTLGRERDYFDEEVLVVCGDLLCNWNVEQMLSFHRRKHALVTVAVRQVSDPRRYGVAVTDASLRIVRFVEKPSVPPSHWISCGIYVLSPEVFAYWQDAWKDLGSEAFPQLAAQGLPIYAYPLSQVTFWSDIGTPTSYLDTHTEIAMGSNIIEPTCRIGRTASLVSVVAGGGSVIERGARLENCIVWPGAVVPANTHLNRAIVTPQRIVEVNRLCLSV